MCQQATQPQCGTHSIFGTWHQPGKRRYGEHAHCSCKCDDKGNIDVADLKAKAEQNKDNLSCLMVTYPSTRPGVRGIHHGYPKPDTRQWWFGLYGWCQYECAGRFNLTRNIGADVCHPQPSQNICHSAWWRRLAWDPLVWLRNLFRSCPHRYKHQRIKGINAVSAAWMAVR